MGSGVKSSCSKSMGELLLGGWTMLAEVCHDCKVPLMRNPQDRTCVCVNCDAHYTNGAKTNGGASPAPNQTPDQSAPVPDYQELSSQPESPASVTASKQTRPSASGTSKDSEEVADLIGSKLLQGWALLDVSCPVCNTPLVRDKPTKRMFCCSCDVWVLTEQQAAAAAAASNQGGGPPPAPAPATPPAFPTPVKADLQQSPSSGAASRDAMPIPRLAGSVSGHTGAMQEHALGKRDAVLGSVEDAVLSRLSDIQGLLQGSCLVGQEGGGVMYGRLEELDRLVKAAGSCVALLQQLDGVARIAH